MSSRHDVQLVQSSQPTTADAHHEECCAPVDPAKCVIRVVQSTIKERM